MKLLSVFSLSLPLHLAALASAQTIVAIHAGDAAQAFEVQPALDSTAPAELIEADAFAALAKGARESVVFDRLSKRVKFSFTLQNKDGTRALMAGVLAKTIYTRPRSMTGPEVDVAAFRVRLEPGERKVLSGELHWEAPEGSVPRLVLPDPFLHPELVLRAQFAAIETLTTAAAESGAGSAAAEGLACLAIGRQSVTWNRRERTVSFAFVLKNKDPMHDLYVDGLVMTIQTRPRSLTGPETDSIGFSVRIPAGESRTIAGTLAWDDLGGAAVPRIVLPDPFLHPELILRAELVPTAGEPES